ncbi:MAG: acyl-ACP thioesterase [Ruminococcus sp.]|nr:acyl-ACP thioesterase [Ruminococcus sp.]
MYTMKRDVECSEIGANGTVRNSSILDYLQDCAFLHLDSHPVMSPYFERENVCMFLVSRQTEIIRRPEFHEHLTIKTWTCELKRMYGFRNTLIYDENGDVLVKNYESGAFMDMQTQRPIKAPQELIEKVPLYPKADMDYSSRKISVPDIRPEIYPDINILKCYIDMNRHVNNARYLDITDEFVDNYDSVKQIRVEYKAPIRLDSRIHAEVIREGRSVYVRLCGDRVYCVVEYLS